MSSNSYRVYKNRRRLLFLPIIALFFAISIASTVFLLNAINTSYDFKFFDLLSALNSGEEYAESLSNKTAVETSKNSCCESLVIHKNPEIIKVCINNGDDIKPAVNSCPLGYSQLGNSERESMSTTTIVVSNSSELKNALSNASGGETIVLKDGYYGDLYISNEKYNSTVTIVAENTLGADFGNINITNGENISIQGVDANDFKVYDSSHIAIKDSHTKIYFSNVYHADIDNNEVDGGYNGITLNDVRHFSVTNNYVHHVQSDLLRVTGDSYEGLIDNNILFDAMPVRYSDGTVDHPDAIQFFARGGSTPHDIVISRNLIVDDRDTGAIYTQGIFLSDPGSGGYQNILIEDNLISVGSPNSIYINGGQKNVVVQNNSLIPNEDGGGSIILAEKSGNDNSGTTVTGNIAKILIDETKSSNIGDNYFYGRDYDISKLFQGDGDTWQDYLPVEGSLAEHYGALDYLNDLLSGNVETRTLSETSTPDSPTPTEPEPQPQPEPETDTSDGSSSYTPADGTVVFALEGETNFNGNSNSVVNVAHSSDWEVGNGVISFGFTANDLSGRQGLFSKDAYMYTGGGNHIAVWLDGSVLYARFQNDSEEAKFSLGNIKTGQLYDVELQFGDNGVAASVNGTLIGSKDLNINFEDNSEYAQIGGLGWGSETGASSFGNAFNGVIHDFALSDPTAQPDPQPEPEPEPTPDPDPQPEPEPEPTPEPEPEPEPQPEPEPEPVDDSSKQGNVTYALEGETTFDGSKNSVVNLAHSDAWEVSEGSISFGFSADTVKGRQGLFSKDAYYYDGGGNHLSVWLQDDTLFIRAQDEDSEAKFEIQDIAANQLYEVDIAFSGDGVVAYVNDSVVGSSDLILDLSKNEQFVQIGGLGWSSQDGDDRVDTGFDGKIFDFAVSSSEFQPEPAPEPELEAQPQPQPEPVDDSSDQSNVSYALEGDTTFDGSKNSVVNLAHGEEWEISEGTISFGFTADTVKGRQGLFSKDAYYYDGGGNHLSVWLQDGTLFIRAQDEDSDAKFQYKNVKSDQQYDVDIAFSDEGVLAYVDGNLVGSSDLVLDLAQNEQFAQIGGLGWGSQDGDDRIDAGFDGTIHNFMVSDEVASLPDSDSIF
ncbi:MAG: right-handed parallel beta-helix repeat-containing protein [Roseibium sp.]|uniref:right-handed parallel beta-helix repeat-containing protein n=1 Tax=Roseibium sp. TaxID=1936156 RepID=UPI003D9C4D0F